MLATAAGTTAQRGPEARSCKTDSGILKVNRSAVKSTFQVNFCSSLLELKASRIRKSSLLEGFLNACSRIPTAVSYFERREIYLESDGVECPLALVSDAGSLLISAPDVDISVCQFCRIFLMVSFSIVAALFIVLKSFSLSDRRQCGFSILLSKRAYCFECFQIISKARFAKLALRVNKRLGE
ncbi:hypothetical protein MJG53_000547 [Ovis ammon polii x Ovis aries]|uniref:Uncharacterized protein n=1 Tax=Ovis ammon polii x Ovis aries TaxID=2918886 RepID=A0ACB9VIC5_9CETA|nr:hypothetical protein MJG53_000547 [Ovis ammon polii x Ovis aries]